MKAQHIVLMAVFASLLVWMLDSGHQLPDNVKSRFSSSECINACWQGIEPGKSTRDDVDRILEDLGLEFNIVDIVGGRMTVYEWSTGSSPGDITIYNEAVTQIVLSMDMCISTIVDSYGQPHSVYQSDEYYYLLYGEDGIIFSTNEYHDLSRASVVFLVGEFFPDEFQYGEKLEWETVKPTFSGNCEDNDV